MKEENIFDAFEYAEPAMIHMAEHRKYPRKHWLQWTAAAAVLALLIGTGLWTMHRHSASPLITEEQMEEPIKDPETPITEETAAMAAADFFETTFTYPAMDARHAAEILVQTELPAYLEDLPEENPFAVEDYWLDNWEIVTKSPNGRSAVLFFQFQISPSNPGIWELYWEPVEVTGEDVWELSLYSSVQKQPDGLWSSNFRDLWEKQLPLPQEEPLLPGVLTQEQVDQVNEAFQLTVVDENDTVQGVNPLCYFLTSDYDRPENLKLPAFLNYFTSTPVEDEAEFQAVRQTEHFLDVFGENIQSLDDFYLPVHRISRKSVDDVLTHYAGIITEDLNDTENLLYLEAYDNYYNFTSDFGLDTFYCTGGTIEGNLVRLEGMNSLLILEQVDGRYLIRSHTTTESGTVLLEHLGTSSLEAEPIVFYNANLEEDLAELQKLQIPQEEYKYGYYLKQSGEHRTYLVSPNATVTIYDISQEYSQSEDRLHTFKTYEAFLDAVQKNEDRLKPPYALTVENGVVVHIEEKFYN